MSNRPSLPSYRTDRVVRVFISSTFRDMQAERDYLLKHVFPELRQRCRERQVEFVEVDLRWGVTQEQAERGEVLPICLREIEGCRPYFIGLLGERYGWVPGRVPPELVEEQPWLRDHPEHSVTALEIMHGVLRNPEMASRAYFYFRDPGYVDRLPEADRGNFLEEDLNARDKLQELKQRIRASKLLLREPYPDPETVGKWILEDLWSAIDQEYPADEVPDPLFREALEHEAFARSRAKVYLGRPEYDARLHRHVEIEEPPLIVLGEAGVGKSALLANWALKYRRDHPDAFIFFHFLGSTTQSADYLALIYRLLSEIKRRFPEQTPGEVPVQPEKLREALPLWLAGAAARGGLVLILDALNSLEDKDNAPDLGWLPDYFPPNVRVILSTLPGRPLEALEKRGWPTMTIKGLTPTEIRHLVPAYLGQYGKTPEAWLLDLAAASPQCSNPLYLKTILEEVRVFGFYEKLREYLLNYLDAATVPALYDKILARLEADYEKERPALAGEALSLIWASRRGLTESELLELLGTSAGPLPRAYWSPLYLALEESLVSCGGLLNFSHDYLRQAVKARYLPDPETERAMRLRLADYFDRRVLDERQVDELPCQLHRAQAWERLKDCLSNLEMFGRLMEERRRHELHGYWLSLSPHYDMIATYGQAINQAEGDKLPGEKLAAKIHLAAFFLYLQHKYPAAESLYLKALTIWEKLATPQQLLLPSTLNNLAELYKSQGRYGEAEPFYQRALAIDRKFFGENSPEFALSLNNLASMNELLGRYSPAIDLYRQALDLLEQIFGPHHPDVALVLNNLAVCSSCLGRIEEAENYSLRALDIREKYWGPKHPEVAQSHHNLADIYLKKDELALALSHYKKGIGIVVKSLGAKHPYLALCLDGLGEIYRTKRNYIQAEAFFKKAWQIRKEVLGEDDPRCIDSWCSLAKLYRIQNRYPEAEFFLKQAQILSEKVFGADHPIYAGVLSEMAICCLDRGLYQQAEVLFLRSLDIRRKSWGEKHPDTLRSMHNLAGVYLRQGRLAAAEPLLRTTLKLREEVLGRQHKEVGGTLSDLGQLCLARGAYNEAEDFFQQALAIWEGLQEQGELLAAKALNNLGGLSLQRGEFDQAESYFRRSREIYEKANALESLTGANILNNLGTIYLYQGRYSLAEPLLAQALRLREMILGPGHPQTLPIRKKLAQLATKL